MSNEYEYTPRALVANYQAYKETVACPEAPASSTPTTHRPMVVAATQMTAAGLPPSDIAGFVQRAKDCVRAAAADGCNVILLQELFAGPYFCQSQEAELLQLADPVEDHVLLQEFAQLARELCVILPLSVFERHNNTLYNTVCLVDQDGQVHTTSRYRKSHIPDGTGYQEKFYFSPGDTGFRVFDTIFGKIGVAICWDQWFPEAARCMALQGADVLLYPTAIGSEPQDPTLQSADHWQRVMQGHSAANMIPVVASNRFGTEILMHNGQEGKEKQRITFYGRSFVTDETGAIVAECPDNTSPFEFVKTAIDVQANRQDRISWGLFRDRRPELYQPLLTKDGVLPVAGRL